jgi:transcriptional antiterminator NusG
MNEEVEKPEAEPLTHDSDHPAESLAADEVAAASESAVAVETAVVDSEMPPAADGGDGGPDVPETASAAASSPLPPSGNKHWYVVKVQSGREDSIKNALERRVKIDNLEEYVGRILIPTEKVTELRNNKRVVKKKKKFPGYLMCEVEYNDKILYLFRETSGVGDFVGGSVHKAPTPMGQREVDRMLLEEEGVSGDKPSAGGEKGGTSKIRVVIPYAVNDRVKVRDGTFKDMEGEVKAIVEPTDPKDNPKVKVELTIWGRPVDVEVEYWQVDPV